MMVVMVVQGRAGVRLVTAGQGDKWQLQSIHSPVSRNNID